MSQCGRPEQMETVSCLVTDWRRQCGVILYFVVIELILWNPRKYSRFQNAVLREAQTKALNLTKLVWLRPLILVWHETFIPKNKQEVDAVRSLVALVGVMEKMFRFGSCIPEIIESKGIKWNGFRTKAR